MAKEECSIDDMPELLQQLYGVKKYSDAGAPSPVRNLINPAGVIKDVYRTPSDMSGIIQAFFNETERVLDDPQLTKTMQTMVTK